MPPAVYFPHAPQSASTASALAPRWTPHGPDHGRPGVPMSPHPAPASLMFVLRGTLMLLAAWFAVGCHGNSSPQQPAPARDEEATIGFGARAGVTPPASISAETDATMRNSRVRQVEQLIAGRFAGVQVIPTTSGGFSIRIRGLATFTGNPEPLYVVDGQPVSV